MFTVMDQVRWHKIEGIIDKALDRETLSEQKKLIARYSQKDQELRQELLLLLKSIHLAQEEDFLLQ